MAKVTGALVDCVIEGRPHVPRSSSGPTEPAATWSIQVINETLKFSRIKGPCEMDVEFILPADRDAWEMPWELTLDHLTKHLLDTLQGTFLGRSEAAEGELVQLRTHKRTARRGEKSGAHILVTRAKARR
jgi:hypothetical protein